MATAVGDTLPPEVEAQLQSVGTRELAIGLLTFENAATVATVTTAVRAGLEKHFADVPVVLINVDAGSSDETADRVKEAGLAMVRTRLEAPVAERAAVPFHGIPGRGTVLRLAWAIARRVEARALVLLEADVTSVTDEWIDRLARPVLEGAADVVVPAHARRRYDGTITNLLLAPLVRALFGRRLHQPLGGPAALSSRALDLTLDDQPRPSPREATDLWVAGVAIAAGLNVWEAWLGPRRLESRRRTTDLPGMMAQSVGGVFTLMERLPTLWFDVHGSAPLPAVGEPPGVLDDGPLVDVARLVEAFQRGVRDLVPIWESVLAPETLGDVLSLQTDDVGSFRFPDDLWARVVYDAALGHRYSVIHREHLLRALVPLYLGRTAAFMLATRGRDATEDHGVLERVATAFERQKPYLTDRWR
ncbi:MAG: glycosyltransferase [Candidatus Rokuibacteriota bacterium]